jgi:hypothetical protein
LPGLFPTAKKCLGLGVKFANRPSSHQAKAELLEKNYVNVGGSPRLSRR